MIMEMTATTARSPRRERAARKSFPSSAQSTSSSHIRPAKGTMSGLAGPSSNVVHGASEVVSSGPTTSQIKTHPVVLTTRTQYVIPTEKYMIPATWRRFHLSQLINKVLALPQPVPFDFIVNGEMLRASLGDWCLAKGIEEVGTLVLAFVNFRNANQASLVGRNAGD